jgi:PiT family inorganic phosphate transporter
MSPVTLIVLTVIAGLLFDFANGRSDSANAIATVVSTRTLSPIQALLMAAILNFVGALTSTAVAKTVGRDVINLSPTAGSIIIVLAAMVSAASWVTWCTRLGLPVSSSHSLLGGMVGAAVFANGWSAVKWAGVEKILIALLASPLLGLIFGHIVVIMACWAARHATPRKGRKVFGVLQLCSSSFMAFEHGKNDAQKVMGVIALALFVQKGMETGTLPADLHIPPWVMISCASAMALGTGLGGWRVIHTLGTKLAKITTTEGFAAETAAGGVLELAATFGVPVSTTHTITGSIVGVGSAKGVHAVKWGIGKKIIYAWVFTLPVCFLLSGVLSWIAAKTSPVAMVVLVAAITVATFVLPALKRRPAAVPIPVKA